jgi:hypothetical protein
MSSPYLTWTYGSQRNLISGQEQSPPWILALMYTPDKSRPNIGKSLKQRSFIF